MARLYPETLPATTQSGAEQRLFELLAEQLDDAFTVFGQVSWLWTNERGQARSAEADIVIVHPEFGMLDIEVKGGQIAFDATSHRWTSTNRGGYEFEIDSPVNQARGNFHNLTDTLASARPTMPFAYPGGHGLAFPDGAVESDQLPLDLPREVVIDWSDLHQLRAKVLSMFRYWNGDNRGKPGPEGVRALVDTFARSWQVRTPLAVSIQQEEAQFRTLTEQQFMLLGFLNRHPRVLVQGCAGSGKTFLAIEKARRLAAQGATTLLTCFNKPLAAWIRSAHEDLPPNLRVQHFHELAHDLIAEAGFSSSWPPGVDANQYFNHFLPERLYDAVPALDLRFDAIIVDEGQDFRDEWWIPLLELLRDTDEGIFYVFYDERQSIYNDSFSFPFDAQPFQLNENLRNTRHIHGHIAHYYGAGVICRGPEGRPPVRIQTRDVTYALERQIRRLTVEGNVSPSDIVVLTTASEERSRWREGQRVGRHSLTWSTQRDEREILVSTVHSFKGLESPVVIVTEMGQSYQDLHLVACSRAKNELIIIEFDPPSDDLGELGDVPF